MQNMNITQKIIAAGCLILLSACADGGKDPAQDYSHLTDEAVAPHNYKPRHQGFISTEIFSVEAEKELVFTEGRSDSYIIRGRTRLDGVSFELEEVSHPDGVTFTPVEGEPEALEVSWTPEVGYIPFGKSYKEIKVQFTMNALEVTNDDSQYVLDKVDLTSELKLIVRRTEKQPVIEMVKGPNAPVLEGVMAEFTITVDAPGEGKAMTPHLVFVKNPSQATQEHKATYEGNSFLAYDNRVKKNPTYVDGKWVFKMLFDTQKAVQAKHTMKGSLRGEETANFVVSLRAQSPVNQQTSPEKPIKVSVTVNPEAAKPEIDYSGPQSLELGDDTIIAFSSLVPDRWAQVSFNEEDLKEQIQTWPGTTRLDCNGAGSLAPIKSCRVHWSLSCEVPHESSVTLNIEAKNQVLKREARSSLSKKINIKKRSELCELKAEKQRAAEVKQQEETKTPPAQKTKEAVDSLPKADQEPAKAPVPTTKPEQDVDVPLPTRKPEQKVDVPLPTRKPEQKAQDSGSQVTQPPLPKRKPKLDSNVPLPQRKPELNAIDQGGQS